MLPRLALFGTPDYSLIIFEKLLGHGYPILLVVTKPERPIGRDKKLTPTPVYLWAKKNNLPIYTPNSDPKHPWQFADPAELIHKVVSYQPDILITADYTQFIPMSLVNKIKYGGLNVHPSLLPKYRGPAPVPWTIMRGETESGVSIVTLSEKFDEGKIVAQINEPVLTSDTTHTLLTRLFEKGADLLVDTLARYPEIPKTQNRKLTTPSYFPRLTRNHGFIPWTLIQSAISGQEVNPHDFSTWQIAKYFSKDFLIHHSSFVIHNSFRALHPWPGLWTEVVYQGTKKRLKLLKVKLIENKLELDEIQLEGKSILKENDALQFIRML